MMYVIRTPVAETNWHTEAITLYPDGQVIYKVWTASGAEIRRGKQFVGASGVAHFLSLFEAAGFHTLAPSYQSAASDGRLRNLCLVVRGDKVHEVQWEPDAVPPSLSKALRELDQFVDVIRASAS
jgi:hypothetical protein